MSAKVDGLPFSQVTQIRPHGDSELFRDWINSVPMTSEQIAMATGYSYSSVVKWRSGTVVPALTVIYWIAGIAREPANKLSRAFDKEIPDISGNKAALEFAKTWRGFYMSSFGERPRRGPKPKKGPSPEEPKAPEKAPEKAPRKSPEPAPAPSSPAPKKRKMAVTAAK